MSAQIEKTPRVDEANNINHNITVKFLINEFETVAQVYAATATVGHVLKDIATKFKLPSKYVTIRRDDHIASKMPYGTQLHQICRNAIGIVSVILRLSELADEINDSVNNEHERIKLDCDVYYRHYRLPDFISVTIPTDDADDGCATAKQVIVEIINIPIVKPFVGGFIDKKTSLVYHNAFTQTGPQLQHLKLSNVVTRDSQTAIVQPIGLSIHGHGDVGNQTTDDTSCVRGFPQVITPRKYVSSEEIEKNRLSSIILIQRNLRRCLWQRLIERSAYEWRTMQQEEDEHRMVREQTILGKFMYKCSIVKSPRTKSDFEMLQANVQNWKDTETARVRNLYRADDPFRAIALKRLLEQEIKLINEIRASRQKLLSGQHDNKVDKILDRLGAPIKWNGYKNFDCEMDLLRTQKTRQLTTLYRQLKSPMKKHDRIEFISRLSDVLRREASSSTVDALADLLNRERDLLVRDLKDRALNILRKREIELFASYIAGKELFDGSKGTRNELNTKMCTKCKAIRSLNDFDLNSRDGESGNCRNCKDLLVPTTDITIYRYILRAMRRDERKHNAISSCAFIVQEEDIKIILDQIWHCRSLLSQNKDLKLLRLPRWNRALDWSPWNCICLTETEAVAHYKISKSLKETYGDELVNAIHCKHELARKTFSRLMHIDADFVESGKWEDVGFN